MSGAKERDGRKIIFVNRYFFPDESATSQILTGIAERLVERGCRVVVVTSRLLYGGSGRVLPSRDEAMGVAVHRVWTTSFGRGGRGRMLDYLSFYATSAWEVLRIARRGDIIVAKTDPPMLSITLLASTRLRRASLVNWLQDVFPEVLEAVSSRKMPSIAMHVLRRLRNLTLSASRANVAIGHRMKSFLVAQGLPRAQITVIPNWADGESIRPELRHSNRLRRAWQLENAFVVAYSGNLGRVHELDIILDAARRTLANRRLVFVLVGGGFHRKRLESLAGEQGLTNVIFKDPVPRSELGVMLTLADVHLVSLKPSLEGCVVPSKIYGAMAAGVPTVFIGDEGGGEVGRLLLDPPQCGVVVSPENGASLATTLIHLAGDPALCAEFGRSARMKFVGAYDVTVAADEWYRLLQQVAGAA